MLTRGRSADSMTIELSLQDPMIKFVLRLQVDGKIYNWDPIINKIVVHRRSN